MAHRRLLSGKKPTSFMSLVPRRRLFYSRQLDTLTSLTMAAPSTGTRLRLMAHKYAILNAYEIRLEVEIIENIGLLSKFFRQNEAKSLFKLG
ncbi:hypothetical protein AVEN_21146-1 [Araneus ventricosus]|uniref:Uncharacterized protein n=1 Tax=Araneus ventricosus TaxID=182803 RepID=A0A4Y2I8G3_ARAVE|nr:hypothetical protein AVEN_21146-1 [Araneus ventricosus]